MKHVEAILSSLVNGSTFDLPGTDRLADLVAELDQYVSGFDREWSRAIELAGKVSAELERVENRLMGHVCENGLLEPVGDPTPLADQLFRRSGFLPADEVAIIKLSDLKTLIADAEQWRAL